MHYKFLLFDLDHTLLDFETAEEIALTEMLTDLQFPDIVALKNFYKPMNQQLWKDLEQKKLTKQELIDSRFAIAFHEFGEEVSGPAMAANYQNYIARQGQSFEGAEDLLKRLSARGYVLYGATNGVTAIQEGRLARSTIAPYFEEVFISEQMGTQKPECRFFDEIGKRITGFDKAKALMIGDSLTADIQGGVNTGIDTLWYNPHQKVNNTSLKPQFIVENYEQILEILR